VLECDPLETWKGAFGEQYIQRSQVTPEVIRQVTAAFLRILESAKIRDKLSSVLEVGANIGINLLGLREVLGPAALLAVVEPNPQACAQLRKDQRLNLSAVLETDASRIPLPDDSYDLVFTSGVLIHIPPDRLPQAMKEIVRVARHYVLCLEYFSHQPVEIPYRGQAGLLWKRDFGQAYLAHCPGLRILQYGFLWQEELPYFDNLNWWMFQKA
jgi:pseudaminic acid biosynthesis-associated methylase